MHFVELGPNQELNSAQQRYLKFGSYMSSDFIARIQVILKQARVTLVEHKMCEGLLLSKTSPTAAIDDLNSQIRLCAQAVVKEEGSSEAKPIVVPSEDLHGVIWRNAQRVIRGLHVE